MNDVVRDAILAHKTAVAASCASFCSVIAGFPFDSLKTRMQTYNYVNLADCTQQTFKIEGFKGFFRGIGPPLITVAISKTLSFTIYTDAKTTLRSCFNVSLDSADWRALVAVSFLSGMSAGTVLSFLSAPLELIKVQKQLEVLLGRSGKLSSFNVGQSIVKETGVCGLYKGFNLQLIRDGFGTGIYFTTYECLKHTFSTSESTNPLVQFLAGGFAGVSAWCLVYPVDLVKSLVQRDVLDPHARFKTGLEYARNLYAEQRLKGFYRGLTPTIVRAFPIHSITFLVYEQVLSFINKIENKLA